MGLFNWKRTGGGFSDVIRCDEKDYLVWKWHPDGTVEDNNRKENSIRWGSALRVRDGSVAVFVYKQKDGTLQDFITGPFDGTIKTSNFPVLSKIIGLAYDGDTPFQAEIYFINLAQIIQLKFAVPYFDVYDPRFLDFGVPTAVRGTISFKITDYKDFIQLHRLETFSIDNLRNQVKDAITKYTKAIIANMPEEQGIPLVQIERKLDLINDLIVPKIKSRFYDEFGVSVSSVDVAVIDIDKTSYGYQKLKALTQDLTEKKTQAKAEIDIKEMRDAQQLSYVERAGRIDMNIKEDAYARHKQTQTSNIGAFQLENQEHVGVASAEALGKMGASTTISGGGGFNPVTMIAGMAVGGALGRNVVGTMNSIMGGADLTAQTPPPIPKTMYYVALNGQSSGPYDMSTLTSMIQNGVLNHETLVWTNGMAEWLKAEEIDTLKSLFAIIPPIPNHI